MLDRHERAFLAHLKYKNIQVCTNSSGMCMAVSLACPDHASLACPDLYCTVCISCYLMIDAHVLY